MISLVTSVTEMALFVFLGRIVDLVGTSPPETFFTDNGPLLIFMGIVVVVVRPVAILLWRGLTSMAFVPSVTADGTLAKLPLRAAPEFVFFQTTISRAALPKKSCRAALHCGRASST